MSSTPMSAAPRRRDRRWMALALTALLIAAGGALLNRGSRDSADAPAAAVQEQAHKRELSARFERAVVLLHAKQYDQAVAALREVLALAPRMPEAHVNMGFALLGLKKAAAARDAFETATQINPMQANAYYGTAMAFEELGDLAAAVGAMRTYLHLARQEDERHLARARAALWEWETQLNARRAQAAPAPADAAKAERK